MFHVIRSQFVPTRDKIENSRSFYTVPCEFEIFFLLTRHVAFSDKRRVAEDEGAFFWREDGFPVDAEGVGVDDVGRLFEGEAAVKLAKGLGVEEVGLVVGEPEGDFGDFAGEFFDFDAVHLVDVDFGEGEDFFLAEFGLDFSEFVAVEVEEDFEFELAKFAIGDDEEIAAAASGIEDVEGGELVLQGEEAPTATAGFVFLSRAELGAEFVEEKRADDF